MVNLSLAPVQPTNVFNSLFNNMNQIEAMKLAHQREQLNSMHMQYLPEQMANQSKLANARGQLLEEQASMYPAMQQSIMNARNVQANLPDSSFGKLLHDREIAIKQFGQNSPQAKAYDAAIQKASTTNKGMQIYGPNGQMIASMGGQNSQPQNFFKNPMMGSYRSGAGGTYVDPNTGKSISTNTMPMTTNDQTAIAAVQRVIPQINNIVNTLPQFQSGWKNMMTNMQGVANRWLGGHYKNPSTRAEGQASLETAPEALLKAYGLRPSEYALQVMKKTIAPYSGENPEGYRNRIIKTLKQLGEFQNQSQARLKGGTPLSNSTPTQTPLNPLEAEIMRRKQSGAWQ